MKGDEGEWGGIGRESSRCVAIDTTTRTRRRIKKARISAAGASFGRRWRFGFPPSPRLCVQRQSGGGGGEGWIQPLLEEILSKRHGLEGKTIDVGYFSIGDRRWE